MFQMSKKMFNKLWPVIATQIESGKKAGAAPDSTPSTPAPAVAAEAGYVLGIALGYSLNASAPASTAVKPRASIHGWQAETCDGLNWPWITSTQIPGAVAISRRWGHGAP